MLKLLKSVPRSEGSLSIVANPLLNAFFKNVPTKPAPAPSPTKPSKPPATPSKPIPPPLTPSRSPTRPTPPGPGPGDDDPPTCGLGKKL